jgi:hypothetical protein
MRKLESYIKKYGEKDGRAMYARLQKEAALASAHARHLGALGGKARKQNLSKEQLSEIGKAAAAKRWAKKLGKKGGK